MTYDEKKVIADNYIGEITGGLSWDDLPDINSLHDCEDESEIINACNERLEESGFELEDELEEV